jgi:flagellin-like protein
MHRTPEGRSALFYSERGLSAVTGVVICIGIVIMLAVAVEVGFLGLSDQSPGEQERDDSTGSPAVAPGGPGDLPSHPNGGASPTDDAGVTDPAEQAGVEDPDTPPPAGPAGSGTQDSQDEPTQRPGTKDDGHPPKEDTAGDERPNERSQPPQLPANDGVLTIDVQPHNADAFIDTSKHDTVSVAIFETAFLDGEGKRVTFDPEKRPVRYRFGSHSAVTAGEGARPTAGKMTTIDTGHSESNKALVLEFPVSDLQLDGREETLWLHWDRDYTSNHSLRGFDSVSVYGVGRGDDRRSSQGPGHGGGGRSAE